MPPSEYEFYRDRPAFLAILDSMGVSGKKREKAILDYEKKGKALMVNEEVGRMQEQQASGFLGKAAGTARAGAIGFADQASLGYLPNIMGKIEGPETQARMEASLQAAKNVNPGAVGVGQLAAFFTPGSMAQNVTKYGGKALAKASLTTAAVRKTIESKLAARATAQIAQNVAGAAGGISALRLLESNPQYEYQSYVESLPNRINQAIEETKSPTTLATSAAFGGISARLTGPRSNKHLQYLFDEFRKQTGKEIPPDIATDAAELQGFLHYAETMPGLAKHVKRVRKELIQGLDKVTQDIGKRAGAAQGKQSERGGRIVRKMVGVKPGEQVASGGVVTGSRRGSQRAALEIEGGNFLSMDETQIIRKGLGNILKGKSIVEDRGSDMRGVIRNFGKLFVRAKRENNPKLITVNDLEAMRKELGRIAYGWGHGPNDPRIAERGRKEAAEFYDVISQAIRRNAPQYGNTLSDGKTLRRLERALADVPVSDLDDAMIEGFFGAGKFSMTRWRALQDYGSPEDISVMKGWYLWNLVEKSTGADGALLESKLVSAFRENKGLYNHQNMDEILPGVRGRLMHLAEIAKTGRKGILKPENSTTARKGMYQMLNYGAVGTIVALFSNPFSATVPLALKTGGAAWLVHRAQKALLTGSAPQAISRMGQGFAPTPISRLPAAVQAHGGLGGVGRTALSNLQESVGLVQSGLQSGLRPKQQE